MEDAGYDGGFRIISFESSRHVIQERLSSVVFWLVGLGRIFVMFGVSVLTVVRRERRDKFDAKRADRRDTCATY